MLSFVLHCLLLDLKVYMLFNLARFWNSKWCEIYSFLLHISKRKIRTLGHLLQIVFFILPILQEFVLLINLPFPSKYLLTYFSISLALNCHASSSYHSCIILLYCLSWCVMMWFSFILHIQMECSELWKASYKHTNRTHSRCTYIPFMFASFHWRRLIETSFVAEPLNPESIQQNKKQ